MTGAGKFDVDDYWPGQSRFNAAFGIGGDHRKANGHGFVSLPPARAVPQSAPSPPPMIVRLASDFHGVTVPEREFLVPGLIPAQNVTALYGNGGTGKSLMALQLAFAAVTGGKWLGQHVNGGDVLFLTAEDDMDEIHRRLVDIAIVEGMPLSALTGFKIVCLAGEDALLAVPGGPAGELVPTRRMNELAACIDEHRPVLVILDTLADLFAGQENDRTHARQFIAMLRGIALRQATTVLLLGHPSLSGMASGAGTSGSTGWSNSVRSRLYLDRLRADDGSDIDPDCRVLKVAKANYASTDFGLRVRWRNGVFIAEAGQSADRLDRRAAENRADDVFLKLIAAYEVEGRHVGSVPAANYAPTVFAKDVRAHGLSMPGLRDAMNRLMAEQRLKMESFGPPSRNQKRIVAVPMEVQP